MIVFNSTDVEIDILGPFFIVKDHVLANKATYSNTFSYDFNLIGPNIEKGLLLWFDHGRH